MFYKIYYIDLHLVEDIKKLLDKLHKLGYPETYLSDFSFCPYLIIHKDFEHNKYPVYENINKGYLDSMRSKVILIKCKSSSELIEYAYELTNDNNSISNGLF